MHMVGELLAVGNPLAIFALTFHEKTAPGPQSRRRLNRRREKAYLHHLLYLENGYLHV